MTTEILRNLLYNKRIQDFSSGTTIEIDVYNDVHTVVFDEVHYMNDKYRGAVWEECFILLPPRIRLINLSATIDNPKHFCNWLAKIKNKDIVHTYTEKRVVPLKHSIFLDYLPSFLKRKRDDLHLSELNNRPLVFSDENNSFNSVLYQDIIREIKKNNKGLSRRQVINILIQYLDSHNLNPSIFFCFSRKLCEGTCFFCIYNIIKK